MKRILSLLLVFVMLLGMLPMSAFADETDSTFGIYLETDVSDPSALNIDDKITVTANIRNNPGFAGMKTKLTWDNTVVTFDGFTTETFRNQEFLTSDVIVDATFSHTAGTVVVGETTDLTVDGMLWEAVFTVIKDGDAKIAFSTEDFQMVNAATTKLEPAIDQTALEGLTITHECDYKETVVAPTCTTGGYTLYKCACGNEYTTNNISAIPHVYGEDGYCGYTCGWYKLDAPADAAFQYITASAGPMAIRKVEDDWFHIKLAEGVTSVYMTSTTDKLLLDGYGYANMTGNGGNVAYPFEMNEDGTATVCIPTAEYMTDVPENGTQLWVRNSQGDLEEKLTFARYGIHYVSIPEGAGYTVTGEATATDGYTFTVALAEGYQAGEDFAIKVNGETVATQPGEVTVNTVNDDIYITVDGVEQIGADFKLTVDLTEFIEELSNNLIICDDVIYIQTGEVNTVTKNANELDYAAVSIILANDVESVQGWMVNDQFYIGDVDYYDEDNDVTIVIEGKSFYLALGDMTEVVNPGTWVIRPIVEEVHVHDYESVVTDPTCTEGGYTTFTCKAGDDTYVGERVLALGHTNVKGTCSTCGASLTVIPEGAPFLEIVTSDGKNVTVTDMGDEPNYNIGKLYKVEVPLGTTQVNITYKQEDVYVDGFGYASVYVVNDPSVSQDGYGQTTSNGKTTVGLQMEKAAANGFGTLNVLNVPYPTDPYTLRAVYLLNDDQSVYHAFAFTYELGEGEHFASLPEGVGYTVSGDPIASDGYKFTVSIDEGFEATEDFAVKVNGEVVATQPGEITVSSVTEDLFITVEGVAKIANADTDIVLTVDLTGYTGTIDGSIWYSDNDYNNVEVGLNSGKKNTLALTASKSYGFFANIYEISPLAIGYDINGTVYAFPNSYTTYDLGDGYNVSMQPDGYLSLGTNGTNPGTFVIKPVLGISESVGAAPDFAEPDVIDVTDITVIGADVVSSAWEGDTLNVVLAEGTAADAALKTMWNIHVCNTKGGSQPLFNINGQMQCPMSAEATFDWTNGITLADGTATMTAAFEVADVYWDPHSQLEFTNKTFTVNFYVGAMPEPDEPEQPEQPEPNPITKVEVSHPNIVTDETGAMTMEIVSGTTEKLNLNIALENSGLEATQEVSWNSSNSDVARVENGILVTGSVTEPTTVYLTAIAVDKAPDPAAVIDGEGPAALATLAVTVNPVGEGYTVSMDTDKTVVADETIQIPVTVTHSDDTVESYKSYEFTFEYAPELLTLNNKSAENEKKDVTIVDDNGTVTVRRYGEALNVGGAAITLEFTAKQTCETNVKLTAAKVGTSDDAQGENIPVAQIADNVTLVTVSGYTVALPDAFTGDTVVAPGAAYTFEAKNKNYTYTVKATIDGKDITVTANEDGTSFTIAEDVITGNVTIAVVSETGKKFDVAITGTGAAELTPVEPLTTGEDAAQYMVDYKAVLTPADGYDYDVKITIGNEDYPCTPDENNVYTIAGSAITGDISIAVNKTASVVAEHDVTFSGTGVEDLVEGYADKVAHNGTYTFSLKEAETYAYTVTASMGGTAVTPVKAETANEDGSFTYTIENVTADLAIQIEKSDLKVEVSEYVGLNGKTVFLVTATQTLPEGKTLAYGGSAMYLKSYKVEGSEEMVQKYSWLAEAGENESLTVEAATAQITVTEATSTVLEQDNYNVNESSALDINDAQLVYDLYNNVYQSIETVGMQKFLRADVNGSGNINVSDAAAVVNAILAAK